MLNYREATIRGLRTFWQTFGGALAGVAIVDVISQTVAVTIGMKLLSALVAAGIAGLAAFANNLGGEPLPAGKVRVKRTV